MHKKIYDKNSPFVKTKKNSLINKENILINDEKEEKSEQQ